MYDYNSIISQFLSVSFNSHSVFDTLRHRLHYCLFALSSCRKLLQNSYLEIDLTEQNETLFRVQICVPATSFPGTERMLWSIKQNGELDFIVPQLRKMHCLPPIASVTSSSSPFQQP